MSIQLNDIKQNYKLETKDADKNISGLTAGLGKLGGAGSAAMAAMETVAKAAIAIGAAATATAYGVNKMLTRQSDLEQQAKYWDAYGAGASRARDEIVSFADSIGVSSTDALKSTEKLLSVWKNPDSIVKFYKMAANGAAAFGQTLQSDKGKEILSEILKNYEELGKTKGLLKVGEELQKWKGLIPVQQLEELNEKFGNSKVTGLQFRDILMSTAAANEGLAKSVADNDWSAQISKMSNEAMKTLDKLTTAMFGTNADASAFGKELSKIFDDVNKALSDPKIQADLKNLGETLKDIARVGVAGFEAIVGVIFDVVAAWKFVKDAFGDGDSFFGALLRNVVGYLGSIVDMFKFAYKAIKNIIKGNFSEVADNIKNIQKAHLNVISGGLLKTLTGENDKYINKPALKEVSENKKIQQSSKEFENKQFLQKYGNLIDKENLSLSREISSKTINNTSNMYNNNSSTTNNTNQNKNRTNGKIFNDLNLNITGVDNPTLEKKIALMAEDAVYEALARHGLTSGY